MPDLSMFILSYSWHPRKLRLQVGEVELVRLGFVLGKSASNIRSFGFVLLRSRLVRGWIWEQAWSDVDSRFGSGVLRGWY